MWIYVITKSSLKNVILEREKKRTFLQTTSFSLKSVLCGISRNTLVLHYEHIRVHVAHWEPLCVYFHYSETTEERGAHCSLVHFWAAATLQIFIYKMREAGQRERATLRCITEGQIALQISGKRNVSCLLKMIYSCGGRLALRLRRQPSTTVSPAEYVAHPSLFLLPHLIQCIRISRRQHDVVLI